jgi:CheY-like chemotaxis protein
MIFESSDAMTCLNYPNLDEINLFLLDISMPGMNGWSLLEALRQQNITIPIIMVSADAYENPDDPLITANANRLHNAYITKPIRDTILLDKVANALELEWCYEGTCTNVLAPNKPNINEEDKAESVNIVVNNQQDQIYQGITESDLREFTSMAEIGFVDGIDKLLKKLENQGVAEGFTSTIRSNLEGYKFADIIAVSKKGLM